MGSNSFDESLLMGCASPYRRNEKTKHHCSIVKDEEASTEVRDLECSMECAKEWSTEGTIECSMESATERSAEGRIEYSLEGAKEECSMGRSMEGSHRMCLR